MPANYTNIEKALINAVNTVDNTTPRGYPNNILSQKDKPDGLWLQISNIRGKSDVLTMGSGGKDEHPGILQIDIGYPKDKGSKEVLNKANEFCDYFHAGRPLTFAGQVVKITACSVGPGRMQGGYYEVILSINYYAQTNRAV